MWRWILAAACLAGGAGQAVAEAPAAAVAPVVLSARGIVGDGTQKDGVIAFTLARQDQRFVASVGALPDAQAFWDALKASNDSGRSITVRYALDSAYIDTADWRPAYVVRELVYDGRTVAGVTRPLRAAVRPDDAHARARNALARSVALYAEGRMADARAAAADSLRDEVLEPPLRTLALKTRGRAEADGALIDVPAGDPERDRLAVAALKDFMAWQAAAPDDIDAALAVAGVLVDLGAYEEALEGYRTILDGWPDDGFWPRIRIGATYRTMGDPARALAALDDLVRADGPQDGMAYHYHRGWTLTELGRLDEAVAELTEGFKTQPDYASANFRRACAYARKGELAKAIADQETGIRLTAQDPGVITANLVFDRARAAAILTELRAAAAKDPHTKLDAPCVGYWDYGEGRRARSPLIPAGAAVRARPVRSPRDAGEKTVAP